MSHPTPDSPGGCEDDGEDDGDDDDEDDCDDDNDSMIKSGF